MSAPVIDPESSVLAYPQWVTWEHQFSATGSPYGWAIASGGFPTGMTWQPSLAVTGENADDVVDAVAHGLPNGTVLVFRSKSGGSGFALNTLYWLVNGDTDTFQLAASEGGAPVNFGSDITAAVLFRPGFLTGAATVPGISTVRLTATNGDGTSAEVLFTIGIEPAAASADANADLVWDIQTGAVVAQNSSLLSVTPSEGPVFMLKEGDDWMGRIRIVKNGTVLAPLASSLRLVLKEFEPEAEIEMSSDFAQQGTGTGTSFLVYMQLISVGVAAALSNYEADAGTQFLALAEFELVFANPESIGPADLVKSSATFKVLLVRDLAENL